VPLADSFDAAAALLASAAAAPSEGGAPALDENSPAAKVASAYGGLQKQLLDAFRGVGVTPVAGAGSPFDPNVHEAVMRELDDSVPDGTVLQEFRRGYAMGDRLVRAAMVKVSYTEGDGGAAAGAGAEAAVAGGGGSESE
jgi:molecular chaperone GrpE